jgi:hypothetical protein
VLFERDFVARAVHMGSTLKTLVQPSSAADALDELFPFNINAQLLESYRTLVNADFFERLKVQGDQLMAAGDYEKALPFYRELLQRDVFAVVPNIPIAARAAGIYLSRGDKESAHRLVAELGLDDAAVMADVSKVPGFEKIGVEQREVARTAAPEGKKCPNCGELVPRVAVRCFRCGAAIR